MHSASADRGIREKCEMEMKRRMQRNCMRSMRCEITDSENGCPCKWNRSVFKYRVLFTMSSSAISIIISRRECPGRESA